jgi:hypothetical protein
VVDIVLETDASMTRNAQVANAGLLKSFPKGFALGDEHAPHMSIEAVLRRFGVPLK